MTAKEPGWPPEWFRRPSLTTQDTQAVFDEIHARIASHFENYGDGIFVHPHEVVGCLFGQLMKLSAAADASNYSGDLGEFRERCVKTLLAMVVAVASVKLSTDVRDEAVVLGSHSPDDFPVGEMSDNDPDQPAATEQTNHAAGPERGSVASDRSPLRYSDERLRELQAASRPLMDFLMKYHNPHVKAIVDSHRVEVVEGLAAEQRVEMDHHDTDE